MQVKWIFYFLLLGLYEYVDVIEKLQYFNNEILRKALSQIFIIHIYVYVQTHTHTQTEVLGFFFHLLRKKAGLQYTFSSRRRKGGWNHVIHYEKPDLFAIVSEEE